MRSRGQMEIATLGSSSWMPYYLLLLLLLLLFSTYALQPVKAYCAVWVRRFNFRHQASQRVPPRDSTHRRKVELWARNVQEFCLKYRLPCYIQGSCTCRKATTWDRQLYFPSERRRAEDFFTLKIRRLRPGANPRIGYQRPARYLQTTKATMDALCSTRSKRTQ